MMKAFGPVPSRRLGKSIGVNNIPHKNCTYSCIYCQVGKAVRMQLERQAFYPPDELVSEVKAILEKTEKPDYITIVPDGEPTLDIRLGELIRKLQGFDIPVAVITNSSLLYLPEVREELEMADYVSVKVDTVNNETWRKINKPLRSLRLEKILEGIRTFTDNFSGKLVTETMLIKGINDMEEEIKNTAKFIKSISPHTAYLAIPTRPPAFPEAVPVDEETLNRAYHQFAEFIPSVEYLTGYEGNAFSTTGDAENDILSITAVHPMREDAVAGLLKKSGMDFDVVSRLIEKGLLSKTVFGGKNYYVRKFAR